MPPSAKQLSVSLASRNYDILIHAGWIDRLAEECAAILDAASRIYLVSDQNVAGLYASIVQQGLLRYGYASHLLLIPAGETAKSVAEATRLWEALRESGADRKSLVLALGGGVVGDLAGFVAATYARGIPFLQIPTTLLAQVDSSVGGKVGINLSSAKNMVGCFWQPSLVAIDVALLRSLPNREYVSGWGEIVKYGMILDADLFSYLETHVPSILARDEPTLVEIVHRCCAWKAQIVAEDERDQTGRRALLNYGHTFAHAIEACSGYTQWLHGEAVAMGMHCAARFAHRIGWIDQGIIDRQEALMTALQLPVRFEVSDADPYLEAMARDKKTERSEIRLILPREIGHAQLLDQVDDADLRAIWEIA